MGKVRVVRAAQFWDDGVVVEERGRRSMIVGLWSFWMVGGTCGSE